MCMQVSQSDVSEGATQMHTSAVCTANEDAKDGRVIQGLTVDLEVFSQTPYESWNDALEMFGGELSTHENCNA